MTEKKKKYLLDNLKLLPEMADRIEQLCDNEIGTDKYAIWIGKESKKDSSIISYERLREIIDWAQSKSPDILQMSYQEALEESKKFHEELSHHIILPTGEKIDTRRIVYNCSDDTHFFYNLEPSDLKREGNLMNLCVWSNKLYADKIKKGIIKIISLRDKENVPHVTIEINLISGESTQVSGYKNKIPGSKYLNLLTEFSVWAAGDSFTDKEKKELNRLMNLHKTEK